MPHCRQDAGATDGGCATRVPLVARRRLVHTCVIPNDTLAGKPPVAPDRLCHTHPSPGACAGDRTAEGGCATRVPLVAPDRLRRRPAWEKACPARRVWIRFSWPGSAGGRRCVPQAGSFRGQDFGFALRRETDFSFATPVAGKSPWVSMRSVSWRRPSRAADAESGSWWPTPTRAGWSVRIVARVGERRPRRRRPGPQSPKPTGRADAAGNAGESRSPPPTPPPAAPPATPGNGFPRASVGAVSGRRRAIRNRPHPVRPAAGAHTPGPAG